ncbi:LON peptidase substrate-binding domain-containing protein [Glycocaulis sp.]
MGAPAEIPLFPIRGCILLPGEALPLNVFEPRYLNMIDDVMAGNGWLGMIQPRETGPRDRPDLEGVGTAGKIATFSETGDGRYLIVVKGVSRFALKGEAETLTPYRVAKADYTPFRADFESAPPHGEEQARTRFLTLLRRFFDHAGIEADWPSIERAPLNAIAGKVAMACPFDPASKQALLEARDLPERQRLLTGMMAAALDEAGSHSGGRQDRRH